MNVFQMGISGSVLIIIILIFRKTVLRNLPKRIVVILWQIVCIRLIIPFSFESITQKISANFIVEKLSVSYSQLTIDNRWKALIPHSNYAKYLYAIWLAGFLILLFFFISMYFIGCAKYKKTYLATDELILKWVDQHKLLRPFSVKYSDYISSPLTYKIFYPVILLPSYFKWVDEKTVKYVLEHEYYHIENLDLVTKLFMIIALCVHWFNPLVWLMVSKLNNDLEMSCDECVLNTIGQKRKKDYATILISLSEKQNDKYYIANRFSDYNYKERIINIMTYTSSSKKNKLCSILAITIISFCCVVSSIIVSANSHLAYGASTLEIPEQKDILEKGYPTNSREETYGPDIKGLEMSPDLILVESETGTLGYIKKEEFEKNQPTSPKEVEQYNTQKPIILNVYLQDGTTIIGEFVIK